MISVVSKGLLTFQCKSVTPWSTGISRGCTVKEWDGPLSFNFCFEFSRWLVKKGRYKKALDVLKRIHQDDSNAVRNLEEIKASINTATKIKMSDTIKFLFRWDILQR